MTDYAVKFIYDDITFAMTNNREHTRKNVKRFVIIDYAIFSKKKKIQEIAKIANVENLLLYCTLRYHIIYFFINNF